MSVQAVKSVRSCVRRDPSLPDEVLYGRAGYLFSLLFVQQHLGAEKIDLGIINQVHKLFNIQ